MRILRLSLIAIWGWVRVYRSFLSLKISPIFAFLKLFLLLKFGGALKVKVEKTVNTIYFRPNSTDLHVLAQVFPNYLPKTHSKIIIQMYKEIIQKGKTPFIVDAGAYIGVTSFFFAKTFPTASILAIEPSAQNYAMLEKNSRELPNIHVMNAAVGPKGKALKVTDPDMGEWGYRTELIKQGDESLPTQSLQFGDLPDLSKSQFPFICKLDIEGAEQYLNESDWDEIMKYSIVIIEPHDWMLPGKHTSFGFMAAHSKSQDPRDIVLVGENIWSIAINSTRAS